ncbi:hypothetical protein [Rosistilla oblonga]|uniref:Uncharacterized protein n=1 Tax=Rosistilla oblonga TaxID=2527990 RepID=A0A518IVT5_9BACT|nr:hypothetical protein [Rosistilla oblonga]QDV57206.1 hypothetical protein Mal33_32090 [Rosistilla oblonga]
MQKSLSESLDQFEEVLDRFEEKNLNASDDVDADEQSEAVETITKDHELDVAATQLCEVLQRKSLPNKPPHRPGTAYRKLIAASGGMSESTMLRNGFSPSIIGDTEVMHDSVDLLCRWIVETRQNTSSSATAETRLAREKHNNGDMPNQGSSMFNPADCDDDLWGQLNTCVKAMETTFAKAPSLIVQRKIGTQDSKYLQNINQLATEAGWVPFVFRREGVLEVLRTNGKKAVCHYAPHNHSLDEVGGEAILNALRAWREKRVQELRLSSGPAPENTTDPIGGQGVTPPHPSNKKSKNKRVASKPLESMEIRELRQLAIIADLHFQWLQNGRKPKKTSTSFDDWLHEHGYHEGKRRYGEAYRHHNTHKSRQGHGASDTTKTTLKEALKLQERWVEVVRSAIDQLGL